MTRSKIRKSHPVSTALLAVLVVAAGCNRPPGEAAPEEAESWSVTAWGELYEVFPEVDPLVAGEAATAHTHVTQLDGFAPMTEGSVEIVLSGQRGEQVFRADAPVRPGIYNVELRPEAVGEYDLSFRIDSAAGREEIPGGRVRVGTSGAGGSVTEAPAPPGAIDGGEPLSFLKEQQWRSDFSTAWVGESSFARSIAGWVRVRPPAGGQAEVTSPVDGVVRGESWPFPGRRVEAGEPLFRIVPRVAAERSLPALEAEQAALAAELGTAQARLSRLNELLALEATSLREVEEARARVETLEARHSAAVRDLAAARSAREGGTAGALTIRAPFGGQIAAVSAAPGETVDAGASLARLVRTDLVWLEVALTPGDARRLAAGEVAGVVLSFPEGTAVRLTEGLRMVSVSPQVDAATGTVAVLLEAPPGGGLSLGATAEAQILLAESVQGVVVPASALVDDAGVAVVYLQLSGESFARQEVEVRERQGERLLVEHLVTGQRLVTRGGEAIRRSSLMAKGEVQGHVH